MEKLRNLPWLTRLLISAPIVLYTWVDLLEEKYDFGHLVPPSAGDYLIGGVVTSILIYWITRPLVKGP